MKNTARILLLCLSVVLLSAPAEARRKHHGNGNKDDGDTAVPTPGPEPAALSAEAAPTVSPDAPPSTSLQPFVDTHLGKILTPLGVAAFAQPSVIASLKAGYADGMAAAPDAHKPAFLAAENVCDAMAAAITERQHAVDALRGAVATNSSEVEQPKGGRAAGATEARDDNAFFVDGQKNAWNDRAAALTKSVTALYLRERDIERQIGAWSPATTTAQNAPPQEKDPVVGNWLWEGKNAVALGTDYSMNAGKYGTWRYVSTTSQGRYYEFHWARPGYVDMLFLSPDGTSLTGKSGEGKPTFARRQ